MLRDRCLRCWLCHVPNLRELCSTTAKILLVGAGAAAQLGEQLLSMREALFHPQHPRKTEPTLRVDLSISHDDWMLLVKAPWAVTLNRLMQPGVRDKA